MNVFYMPAKLRTGEGAVRECADEIASFGSKCLIVTGKSSAKLSGALDDIVSALDSRGVAYSVFDRIGNNPSVPSVIEAGRTAAESGADFIIGAGGGSALDAAKAAAVIAANPSYGEAELYSKKWEKAPLPVVLVGTTAGTGSEVTSVSVLTNSKGLKKSVNDPRIFASLSIGDPKYTYTMSRTLTLTTAVDALSHCLESRFSKKSGVWSRDFAARGAKIILPVLEKTARGEMPDNADRETLYEGSIFGGLAISVTGTCFPHNVGYYLTENFGVPHGFACAFFLDDFIRVACREFSGAAGLLREETGYGPDEISSIVGAILPPAPELTGEEIAAALPRWENNPTVMNSPGHIGTDFIGEMLVNKFVKRR